MRACNACNYTNGIVNQFHENKEIVKLNEPPKPFSYSVHQQWISLISTCKNETDDFNSVIGRALPSLHLKLNTDQHTTTNNYVKHKTESMAIM